MEHRLKPFIPDYIPAVGDIDAFIKIPRPDGVADTLGLTILDEPALKQSDPTVLDLTLRAVAKQSSAKAIVCLKNQIILLNDPYYLYSLFKIRFLISTILAHLLISFGCYGLWTKVSTSLSN